MGKSGHIWEIPKKKYLQDLLISCSLSTEGRTKNHQGCLTGFQTARTEGKSKDAYQKKGRVIYGKNGICNSYQCGGATVFPLDGASRSWSEQGWIGVDRRGNLFFQISWTPSERNEDIVAGGGNVRQWIVSLVGIRLRILRFIKMYKGSS